MKECCQLNTFAIVMKQQQRHRGKAYGVHQTQMRVIPNSAGLKETQHEDVPETSRPANGSCQLLSYMTRTKLKHKYLQFYLYAGGQQMERSKLKWK